MGFCEPQHRIWNKRWVRQHASWSSDRDTMEKCGGKIELERCTTKVFQKLCTKFSPNAHSFPTTQRLTAWFISAHSLHDFCLAQLYMSRGNGCARRRSGLEGWKTDDLVLFFHLPLISVLARIRLYFLAHRHAAPCHPSLSRHASSPWRSLLKTDQRSSATGLPRSDQGALLTFVCLTPNYDALRSKGVLMTLHVLNIWAAPPSKGHLQQDPKYAYRK